MMKKNIKHLNLLLSFFLFFNFAGFAQQITPKTALKAYINNNDQYFSWKEKDYYELDNSKVYNLFLTSQKWKEYIWQHQLTVIVPSEVNYKGALLYITGCNNSDGTPIWQGKDNKIIKMIAEIAIQNKAITAVLFQVPNQPLFNGLTEDALVAFTLSNYLEDKNFTWPLLFPMTKSAIRAMDAIQQFSQQFFGKEISYFLISGESKRGWTTWLTAATDSRVKAIAPMVINMLNMPKSIPYHVECFGDYSANIRDFVNLGVAQKTNTPEGKDLVEMIDPFSYREKLTMPKFIFSSTNDLYWPIDVVKFYFEQLPGKNYLHYVANVGHDLGDKKQVMTALSAFFSETLLLSKYPECLWKITENKKSVKLKIKTSPEKLTKILLWKSDSEDRDFRDNYFSSTPIKITGNKWIEITIPYPATGFLAFYVDLLYYDPNGNIYSKSTRVFVANNKKIL